MNKQHSFNLWKTIGTGAVSVGIVWAALWAVLSLAFPWKVTRQFEGFLLDPEAGPGSAEAVELSFEGEWTPPLVGAVCGERFYAEYTGELTVRKGAAEEQVSLTADPQGEYIICQSTELPWEREAGPWVTCDKDSGIMVTALSASNQDTLLLVCGKDAPSEDALARVCREWMESAD